MGRQDVISPSLIKRGRRHEWWTYSKSWQLPRLGRMGWENAVACPHGKDKTIVACMDDGLLSNDTVTTVAADNPSEVFIYIGSKQTQGNEIERVGLTNGKLYGIRVRRNDGTAGGVRS